MEVVSFPGINLDTESTARQLQLSDKGLVGRLADMARIVSVPSVAFRAVYVDEKSDSGAVLGSMVSLSKVLQRNLEGVDLVFPFVITLGKAMDELIETRDSMLEKYLIDEIGNLILQEARCLFECHLMNLFSIEKISCVVPGSLEDFPINQQKNLFDLLPDVSNLIGVKLTENFLMLPLKSISGIYFSSKSTFFSCQLCSRERCRSRKARYNEKKALEYGVCEIART